MSATGLPIPEAPQTPCIHRKPPVPGPVPPPAPNYRYKKKFKSWIDYSNDEKYAVSKDIIGTEAAACVLCYAIGSRSKVITLRFNPPVPDPSTNGKGGTPEKFGNEGRQKVPAPNEWSKWAAVQDAFNKFYFDSGATLATTTAGTVSTRAAAFRDAELYDSVARATVATPNIPAMGDVPIWGTNLPNYPETPAVKIFYVVNGENGETFHGLFAGLITNTNFVAPDAAVTYWYRYWLAKNEAKVIWKKDSSSAQRQLLRYFLSAGQVADAEPGTGTLPNGGAKPDATFVIARYFWNRYLQQQEIHRSFRQFLNDESLSRALQTNYVTPSRIAKYWINRYFVETGQHKLPKAGPLMAKAKRNVDDVAPDTTTRVAVILVRAFHTAPDRRIMDEYNLRKCMDALVLANEKVGTVVGVTAQAFSHVIFYGDLEYQSFARIKRDYRASFTNILLLASPFYTTDPTVDPLVDRGRAVWAAFKDFTHIEYMPVEVKALGIYLALRERYGDYLAFIGWRSGSLDLAGFLGIPIFCLDTVLVNDHRNALAAGNPDTSAGRRKAMVDSYAFWRDNYSSGDYLWNIARYPLNQTGTAAEKQDRLERMENASRCLSSFIWIHIPIWWGARDASDKTQFTNITPPYVNEIQMSLYKITPGPVRQLAAALFMYSARTNKNDLPYWVDRNRMMRTRKSGLVGEGYDWLKKHIEKTGLVSTVVTPEPGVVEREVTIQRVLERRFVFSAP